MVATLEEVATTLHRQNRWRSHVTDAVKGTVDYVSEEGVQYRLDCYGVAEKVVNGQAVKDLDIAEYHDIHQAMCWTDMIWGTNDSGERVAIHL